MRRFTGLVLLPLLLSACGDGSSQFTTGFTCRAVNINLGECLVSNGIVGHEHKVLAEIIFDNDHKYRVFPRGEQCFIEYNVDTVRNGKRIRRQFECEIPASE